MTRAEPPEKSDAAQPPEGAAARFLRRLVLVERGEGAALVWSALYFFFLLSAYYVLRPVRETMGVQRGMDDLAWLFTGTMIVMFAANPVFSLLTSRTPRRTFIPVTYQFFALNLLVFYGARLALADEAMVAVGYVFYVWLSVFNLFAVSVFWAFMADIFTTEQGKRLFAFIGVGGTLGAMFGAGVTTAIAERVGTANLLLVSVVLLQLSVVCVWRLRRVATRRALEDSDSIQPAVRMGQAEPTRDWLAGWKLLWKSPYLMCIAGYVALMTILATFVYFEQARWVSAIFVTDEERTSAFAMIDLVANALTLLFQVFLTSRLVRSIGVGPTLAALPLITVIGFVALTAAPMFATFVAFQATRRAAQYAIARPVREVLYTVVGPDEKYKSKAFIDTFVYRGGDFVGAWAHRGIAAAAIPLAPLATLVGAVWLLMALQLGRLHGRTARRDVSRAH